MKSLTIIGALVALSIPSQHASGVGRNPPPGKEEARHPNYFPFNGKKIKPPPGVRASKKILIFPGRWSKKSEAQEATRRLHQLIESVSKEDGIIARDPKRGIVLSLNGEPINRRTSSGDRKIGLKVKKHPSSLDNLGPLSLRISSWGHEPTFSGLSGEQIPDCRPLTREEKAFVEANQSTIQTLATQLEENFLRAQ